MPSFAPPQRRTRTPVERPAASVVAALTDAAPVVAEQSAGAPRDLDVARRPLAPLPLLRADGRATPGPPPHIAPSPLSAIRPPAAPPSAEGSVAEPREEGATRDAAPEALGRVAQARMPVKQVGSGAAAAPNRGGPPPVPRKNATGLPNGLKAGVEALAGLPLDDVRVHYASSRPADIGALAYTQGNKIYIGPGQERHLGHEAWHVVQQKRGRVRATMQAHGAAINDDPQLEREADAMGAKASASVESDTEASTTERDATQPMSGPVIQRNAILKHEYRTLENPAFTVAKHLGRVTGLAEHQVLADLWWDVPTAPADRQLARPDRVIAHLDAPPAGGGRVPFISQIGRLGYLEEALRNRAAGDTYDGGHLLALSFYNAWPLINDASNLAPQRTTDNRWRGAWRQAEIALNRGGAGIVYEASVSYPDRTYTVTAGGMARALDPASATFQAVQNLGLLARWFPWTVHTWVPSQFALSVTPLLLNAPPTNLQTLSGYDPTNWLPIVHRIASPIKGAMARLVPIWEVIEHHQGIGGVLGGVDIRTQQNHPLGDAMNEFKQLAWDIAKLTAVVAYALPLVGVDANAVLHFAASIPGIGYLDTLMPGFIAAAPHAAILIYAMTHQLNITRLIPEWIPGAGILKYILGLLGL